MDKNQFKDMVEKYKNELLKMAGLKVNATNLQDNAENQTNNSRFNSQEVPINSDSENFIEQELPDTQTDNTYNNQDEILSRQNNIQKEETDNLRVGDTNQIHNIVDTQTGATAQVQNIPGSQGISTVQLENPEGARLDNNRQIGLEQNNAGQRSTLPFEQGAPYTGNAAGDDSTDETYQEFLGINQDYGFLKVQAFMARQSIPVSGVKVKVSKQFSDGEHIFFEGVTDESGIIDDIKLPAPSELLSEQPEDVLPYAEYDFSSFLEGYSTQNADKIQIFQNIKSIQPVIVNPT